MSYNPYGSTAPTTYGMLLYQADLIRNSVNSAYTGIIQQVVNSAYNVAYSVDMRYTQLVSLNNAQTSQIVSAVNSSVNQIVNSINGATNLVRQQIVSAENSIKSAVTVAANSAINRVSVAEMNLSNKLSDSVNVIVQRVVTGDNLILDKLNNLNNIPAQVVNSVSAQLTGLQNNIISAMNTALNQSEADIINGVSAKLNTTDSIVRSVETNLINQMNTQFSSLNQAVGRVETQVQTADTSASIWDAVPGFVNGLNEIANFFNSLGQFPAQLTHDVSIQFASLNNIITKLEQNGYTDYQEFVSDLNSLGIAGSITKTLWDAGKFIFMVTYGLMQSYSPFIDNIKTLAQSQANNNLLTPTEYLAYWHRFGRNEDELKLYLSKLGYSDSDIQRMKLISFSQIDPATARYLYLQGKIDEETHDMFLEHNGFSLPSIAYIKKTYFATPPAQDLITMAVREAFTPEIANTYGQYENYPQVLTEHMRKQGIDETWSKAYWASHWKLPSPEQGFEMFHRGIINETELKDLLRALDVMPHWRDKLIQLNYDVLRLVDIRRFYQLGVINEEQLFKEFKARGYDDERAGWAVEYTIKSTSTGTELEEANRRLLSQTVIVKAYKTGRINHSDAIYALTQLRYTQQDAQLLLDLSTTSDDIDAEERVIDDNRKRLVKLATDGYAKRLINLETATSILLQNGYTSTQVDLELGMTDYEQNELMKAQIVQHVGELFTTFQIDRDSASVILSARGFEAQEINRALQEYEVKRDFRANLPTLATLQKWLKNGLIDLQFFVNGLKGLGYSDNYIELYAMEVIGAIQQ